VIRRTDVNHKRLLRAPAEGSRRPLFLDPPSLAMHHLTALWIPEGDDRISVNDDALQHGSLLSSCLIVISALGRRGPRVTGTRLQRRIRETISENPWQRYRQSAKSRSPAILSSCGAATWFVRCKESIPSRSPATTWSSARGAFHPNRSSASSPALIEPISPPTTRGEP